MMRFTNLVSLGAAALLVVPAATLQQSDATGLAGALDRTGRALEALRALESDVAAGEPTAIERLLAVTQAPHPDAPRRDERLSALRDDVSALRQHLDELEALRPAAAGDGATAASEPGTPATGGAAAGGSALDSGSEGATAAEDGGLGSAHTGLSPSELERLRDDPPPILGADPQILRAEQPRRFEPEGFSADPVRHGRAYYEAGRYAEALVLLETRPDDLRARYWSAHCLERLGKDEAALALYRAIAATDPATVAETDGVVLVERAGRDAEFLEWRRAFDARLGRLDGEAK